MAIIDNAKATGSQKVLINDWQPSFGEIEIVMGGKTIGRATSINYSTEVSAVRDFGTNNFSNVQTVGQSTASCDFEIYLTEAQDFINELGDNFRYVKFDISVMFRNVNSPIFRDEILGVSIIGVSNGFAKGSDALVRQFTCSCDLIKYDGKSLLTRVQQ